MGTGPEITHDVIPGITTVGVPREKVEAVAADLGVRSHVNSIRPELIQEFEAFEEGWDSYGGKPIGDGALKVLEALHVSPVCDGGVQVEIHANGWEVEVRYDAAGRVVSFICEQADEPPGCPHPEDERDEAISHLGDPDWAYCLQCFHPIHRSPGGIWRVEPSDAAD